jgi:hypothetical protein
MQCPNCQTENRDSARFCRVSGFCLKTKLTCPQFGHINPRHSKFFEKYIDELTGALVRQTAVSIRW